MPKKETGKPKGPMTSYAAFVQVCREEHKKKHPDDRIVFAEFSKKCSERWKKMGVKEKKRFTEIASKDKARFTREMEGYVPPPGQKKKQKKDPDAPKRALSAFFFFCGDHRAEVKARNPSHSIGDIAKELGKRWERVTSAEKSKYEEMAANDKKRYEREMAAYTGGKKGKSGAKAAPEPMSEDESEGESD